MAKKKSDPLILELESALDLGEFISYNRSWDYVQSLENVKHKIDALVKDGQGERAVRLYELFLSGCYEKADEIDVLAAAKIYSALGMRILKSGKSKYHI